MDWLTLVAKLTLDKSAYEQGLNEAEQDAVKSGGKFSGALGKVGKIVGTVGKVAAGAIAAGSVAVGALAKQSVQAYAEYEQLSGGVKKLFGDASDTVMQFANDAYKTAGLSANEYMEQVTSFSAALINSLGGDTEAAAKSADVAMRAMSDNVNTFGTDMGAVQAAFQGFSKQNYTMLDNLKLGYGGTKTEMERLIADANEYAKANGQAADLSIESFADIVQAIELIQEKQGIAGTTAKEAATTIEGSFNTVKGAWTNLVAGFANPDADMDKLMDNLIVSIVGENEGEGLLNQLIPAVERALRGIGEFLVKAAPIIAEQLPNLMNAILPSLLQAATSLVAGLVQALPTILQVLIEQVPVIITTLIDAIVATLPLLVELGKNLLNSIWEGLHNAFPELFAAWDEFWTGLKEKLSSIWETIKNVVDFGIQFLAELFNVAFNLLTLPWQFIWQNFGDTITKAWNSINAFISNALSVISSTISTVWNAISSTISTVLNAISTTFSNVWNSISSFVSGIVDTIRNNISDKIEAAKSAVTDKLDAIKQKFTDIFDNIKSHVSGVVDWLKGVFDFHWELPHIKLPHFSIEGSFSLNPPSVPHFSIDWYKKAYDVPYLFTQPTIMPDGRGYGDGKGGEMVYGHENLMDDIKNAVKAVGQRVFAPVINIYTQKGQSNEEIAQYVMDIIKAEYDRSERVYA